MWTVRQGLRSGDMGERGASGQKRTIPGRGEEAERPVGGDREREFLMQLSLNACDRLSLWVGRGKVQSRAN